MEIVLKNQPAQRQELLTALESFARQHHLSSSVKQAADLALEEHFTNVLNYAFADTLTHKILVRFDIDQGYLAVEVEDDGKPFNPLQVPAVDTSQPLDRRPVGGLGIHLIRKFMDELAYRRESGRNILLMRKRLPQ